MAKLKYCVFMRKAGTRFFFSQKRCSQKWFCFFFYPKISKREVNRNSKWNQRLKPAVPLWFHFDPHPSGHGFLPALTTLHRFERAGAGGLVAVQQRQGPRGLATCRLTGAHERSTGDEHKRRKKNIQPTQECRRANKPKNTSMQTNKQTNTQTNNSQPTQ